MIHRITNPLIIGQIASLIQKFHSRIKETSGMYDGITYESLYAYATRVVQFGGDRGEFWLAMEDNVPVGFAIWRVLDLPHIGTVHCDAMYNDTRNQKSIKELYDEFISFGQRQRALIYRYDAVNDKVGDYFKHVASKLGIEFVDSGAKNYIGRKK